MTEPKKKKAVPKKATSAQVVKYLSDLQRTGISSDDRSSVSQVIRLLSK